MTANEADTRGALFRARCYLIKQRTAAPQPVHRPRRLRRPRLRPSRSLSQSRLLRSQQPRDPPADAQTNLEMAKDASGL